MTHTTSAPTLVWFRDDLRLADNPALAAALAQERPLILLYVLDEATPGLRSLGGAARWWLGRSLAALAADIERAGGSLLLRRGPADEVLRDLVREAGVVSVHWNRRYDAGAIALDRRIKAELTRAGVEVTSHSATLLHEPWTLRTKSGGPYRVFTPFYRAAAPLGPRRIVPRPEALPPGPDLPGDTLAAWHLEPAQPDWAGGLRASWQPGEAGAHEVLRGFLDHGIHGYAERRDRPDSEHTSRLSPFLRFGNLSPVQALAALHHAAEAGEALGRDVEKFRSELYWREFSYHLLFHNPDLATTNVNHRFDSFAWRDDGAFERAWRRGRTGYPIVDAGMRQLWQTGWMHNRVRMIAASFLIKHGLVDWRRGEAWFWDTLVDADPANNPASWQWVAGSGADAAPYFRIFNPMLQGEKFDPDGAYVRRFVPELAELPADVIHQPWRAKPEVLARAGVELGTGYPRPIVEHGAARERALAAYHRSGEE
ncbi:cryptochrome/photolyase family protein [Ancylobacter defluvii]|uniref:Deoxyribodipyrimidine photo-lyase n=1 Tax=Ancylobacter defluvii TaxID=1282440 RepID=A0A9W6NBH2_9HYPH|nr:deoxyribodipyrimidine photo-lyase [Ancylobacter defluvii]MBS7588905.1 deoxyribodipyrimidine photo-lyase [Ancylobacter defluvii]GLK84506.1 deoxyribodipyrimidine photo-lyase [Ancylobacter defluvii]